MPRRLYSPPAPKRRITPRTKLPPEAEALFNMTAMEEFKTVEESPEAEDMPSLEPEDAQQAPELQEAVPELSATSPAPTAAELAEIPEWINEARKVDLLAVAREAGIDIVSREDGPGFAIAPCPACGDSAGAAVTLNLGGNTRQWKCPSCKSHGGSLDLAALTLMGERLGELDDEGQAAVREWFASRGWCGGG